MKNDWAILGILLVLGLSAAGQTVLEQPFLQSGFERLATTAGEPETCRLLNVSIANPPSDADVFVFLSVAIPEVDVRLQKGAGTRVSWNGKDLGTQDTKDLFCDEGQCRRSLFVPPTAWQTGANLVEVCAKASESVPRVELLPESTWGFYRLADFSQADSFIMRTSQTNPVIGQTVRITYAVKNNGHAPGRISIDRAVRTAKALDKPYYRVVEGQSFVEDEIIEPGQTREFEHAINVRITGPLSLPPAVIHWQQDTGTMTLDLTATSNQPMLDVREPDRSVEAFYQFAADELVSGQPANVTLHVRNSGDDPLYNMVLEPVAQTGLEITSTANATIDELLPGQTHQTRLVVRARESGDYSIRCDVQFLDLGLSDPLCKPSTLAFRDKGLPPLVIASAILLVLSLGIYAYFSLVP